MEIKQYYEMFRDFKGMLVDKGYELTLHKNNINAIETIERMDKANAISFLIYIFEFFTFFPTSVGRINKQHKLDYSRFCFKNVA